MATEHHAQTSEERLPARFRPLFWSYRFDELDAWRDEKAVVVQLLNYGTLADWRWLVREYGATEVKRVLQALPATELKSRTRVLASLLFSISTWHHAPRGAY